MIYQSKSRYFFFLIWFETVKQFFFPVSHIILISSFGLVFSSFISKWKINFLHTQTNERIQWWNIEFIFSMWFFFSLVRNSLLTMTYIVGVREETGQDDDDDEEDFVFSFWFCSFFSTMIKWMNSLWLLLYIIYIYTYWIVCE